MKKILIIILLLLIIFIFYFRCSKTIYRLSPTYDEPLHLMQGYSYLKTGSLQVVMPDDQPMLAKIIAAIPLLFLSPQPVVYTTHPYWLNPRRYSFANLMLYNNICDAEFMLNLGRKSIIFISCVFIVLYFFIINSTADLLSAILACILYTFSSTIIAHSCLVTQDLLCAVLYCLSIYLFYKSVVNKNLKYQILCGITVGLLFNTKYTVVVLLATYTVLLFCFLYIKTITLKDIIKFCVFQIFGIVFVGLVVYGDKINELFLGLIRVISIVQEGRSTFFFGKYSTKGFRLYFLTLFFLKTEIPLIVLFLYSVMNFIKKSIKQKFDILNFVLLISIAVYIFIASMSKMQIGHRHLLPVYPLLFWFICNNIDFRKIFSILLISSCCLWLVINSFKIHPWYISYFNEIIGGSKNGWKYFTDSNIDWGQGLKELALWIKQQKVKSIYFSYFGVGDPHYYGIKYKPIGFIDNLTNDERKGEEILDNGYNKVILAVSVTNLQCTYYREKDIFNFVKNIKPLYVAGQSIFVYDLTNKTNELKEFTKLLERLGYDKDVLYIKSKFLNIK